MLKKLISYAICICVMLGMVICPADAAAPIVYDGKEVTHFDQSFGGGTDASSFADFDITNGNGTWLYAPDYIMETSGGGKAMTKKAYNLFDTDSFEFKIKTITTNNGFKLFIGDYVLSVNRNLTVLFNGPIKYTPTWGIDYDHENCLAYTNNENGATPVTGTSYGGVVNTTVRVEKRKISISTDVADRTGTLVYNVKDGEPDIAVNGKFGVEGGTNENFTLFSMSLKSGQTAIVNDWRFDHTFSAADTVESLASQGLYFNEEQYSYDANNGYAVTTNNAVYEFAPGNAPLSGDYTFEVKTKKDGGTQYVRFNCVSDSNYYELAVSNLSNQVGSSNFYGGSRLALYKIKNWQAAELAVVDTVPLDADDTTGCIPGVYSDFTFKITQAMTEAGKTIDITVSAIRDGKYYTYTIPTVTDAEPFASGGSVKVANSTWGGTTCPVYYIKAWSAPSGEDTVADVTLIDKSINETDTQVSVANDYSIISPGGLVNRENRYGLDGVTAFEETSYDKVLSGSYTVTTDTRIEYNSKWYYINYIDENNYYRIDPSKTGPITVVKKKNGVETPLTVTADAGNGTYSNGYAIETTSTEVKLADDTLTLNITRTANGNTVKYSVTDPANPITSGKFKIGWGSNGSRTFYSIKVVRHSRPSGVIDGVFKVNDAETYAYNKGVIKFAMPTAVIGKYKVIAALYENDAMTDVKVLDEFDVYRGDVTLFDTTNSSAKSGSVKVYLVDTTDTLNKITDVWELK